ncbi:hypothetical protein DAETH_07660 [Deinococcus aetherius]|uniref:Uncharacterized protein n=1 Tax=Deinococcus aetherius TaxID=200252 RepID=A0ABM8AAL1_9DEIO|nr:hypothetical protein [Deinococcus aetherius]BDP40797.1 hypothetical protein DAETH_07660 [Deinococcus aetherius]
MPVILVLMFLACVVAAFYGALKIWGATMGSGEDGFWWFILIPVALLLGLLCLIAAIVMLRRASRGE